MRGRLAPVCALLGALALGLAACGRPEGGSAPQASPEEGVVGREADEALQAGAIGSRLCEFIGDADAGAVFDAPVVSIEEQPGETPACLVTGKPGRLEVRLARSAGSAFNDEAAALRRAHAHARVLGDLGSEALMALTPSDAGFKGAVLMRKGADVLTLEFEGADPAAAEALARRLAEGV